MSGVTKEQVLAAIRAALDELYISASDSQGSYTADVTLDGVACAMLAAEKALGNDDA